MKMLRKLMSVAFLIGSSLAVFTACSSGDEFNGLSQNSGEKAHVITMKMIGSRTGFDANQTRSGEVSVAWKDGDRLYLQFAAKSGSKKISGYATYMANTNTWELKPNASLPVNESLTCQVYYFENPVADNSARAIQLDENTAIYQDLSGSYLYDGDNLTVNASLKPKTSRLRFAGKAGTPIIVEGISHFVSYDIEANRFDSVRTAINDTIYAETGYTPYIYGSFSDSSLPRIRLVCNSNEGYTMNCSASVFKVGESGYLTLPTPESHGGWVNGLDYTIRGVDFKMIPIAYELGDFLMAETELTEGLYCAVVGATTDTPNMPKTGLTFSEFYYFIDKLNAQTGLRFYIPTQEEWNKACVSYLGDYNDVAWNPANSDGMMHEVKQKMPNMYGLYDMYGNVAELTSTEYKYSAWSSSYYYCMGDYYNGVFDDGFSENSSSDKVGLRLALSF